MTYHEKRIKHNQLILKIQNDEVLNIIFRSVHKYPNDLYKYVDIVRKSLLTLDDDELFLVIKNFWSSILKISKISLNDLKTKFSITKKTSLNIIFSSWIEILEYSRNHNDKYKILDLEYFDIVAKFFCSPNINTIHTLATYIQPNKTKLEERFSSLDFWKTSPKLKEKKYNKITISNFSDIAKHTDLINLIKFGLRCRKAEPKLVLSEFKPNIEEKFEIYHYEFKDKNPRVELNAIKNHMFVCIFDKGFYEYSKSQNYFDFKECLMVTWSKFTAGYRYTPWGFANNKIGFLQIDTNKRFEFKKDKRRADQNKHPKKKKYRQNVYIDNYQYSYELKDLELLIFSFHKTKKGPYKNTSIGLPFKIKKTKNV